MYQVNDMAQLPRSHPPIMKGGAGSILIEAPLDKFLDLLKGLFAIGALTRDAELRPLAGGQHHEAHDTLPVDLLSIAFHPNIAFVTIANLHEHRRGTSMQTEPVEDGDLLRHFVRGSGGGFTAQDAHLIGALFLHFSQQALIKFKGAVLAHTFQLLIQRRHFDQAGQVATSSHGDCHMRNKNSKNFIKLLL